MSRTAFDPALEDLPRVLPIFPLEGVLLLPGGRLPLNIFEPRYLAMFDDALASQRLIGMIQPCEASGEEAAPKVYETGCVGRITSFTETDDGRYLVTLCGLIRFDVVRELPSNSYRQVEPDFSRFAGDLQEDRSKIDRNRLMQVLSAYFEANAIEGDWEAIEASVLGLLGALGLGNPLVGLGRRATLASGSTGGQDHAQQHEQRQQVEQILSLLHLSSPLKL